MVLPFGIGVRTYARNIRKFLHHDTRCFPTPPVGLLQGPRPYPLPPRGPGRPGTHYRHYHEFPQLLRLCCTATKMAAGCILPCEEDALLSGLLLFLLWRLRCRHVVLRYTARQLTSRMAAVDGGDN